MSLTTFLIAYAILATLYLYLHRPTGPIGGRARAPQRKAGAIRKVTDLRLGLEHPTRGEDGRFISRQQAADEIQDASLELEYDFHHCLSMPRPRFAHIYSRTPRLAYRAQLWSIERSKSGQLIKRYTLPF